MGSHIGAILGPSSAILWVMLKLSRAMVGHVGAVCQRLFGHVVAFVSQSAPRNTKILSGFWRATFYLLSIGGSNARMEATFWAPIWAKSAILGPVKVSGSYSHREVTLTLSWAMLCYVKSYRSDFLRPCCWFCNPKCFSPQQDQDIERVSASYVCSIWGQSTAARLSYGHVGAILRPISAILGLC